MYPVSYHSRFTISAGATSTSSHPSTNIRLDRVKKAIVSVRESNGLCFENLSEDLRNNIDVVRETSLCNRWQLKFAGKRAYVKLIKEDPGLLKFASEQLKDDKKVVLLAVKGNGMALKFASDTLKDDEEVVMTAILENSFAIHRASIRLQNDPTIFMRAHKWSRA